MAIQNLNLGSGDNVGDGDTLRAAMTKVQANTVELYERVYLAATTDPTANDDGVSTSGNGTFEEGSVWIRQDTKLAWLLVDNTTTAAVWAPLGLLTAALLAKLNGIEALADVTDATNVAAAGAVMDSDTSASFDTISESTPANGVVVDGVTLKDGGVNLGVGSAPAHSEGLIFYDNVNKALAVYNDEAEITLQVGQEVYFRAKNNTGSTITNGSVVYISGGDANLPTIALANANASASSLPTIGIATHDIETATSGMITRIGTVRNVNTASYTAGQILYLDTTSGAITGTPPTSPNYLITIGTAGVINATTGTIEVHIDKGSNTSDVIKIFNGSVLENTDVNVTSNGSVVTLSVQKAGGGDLSLFFDAAFTNFDTTPAATVTLAAGSDTAPTLNYVFVPKSTGLLTSNTTGFPLDEQVVPLASVLVQSAISVQSYGCYKCNKWSNNLSDSVDVGHLNHINYWIRSQAATWINGIAPTTTITPSGIALDTVNFTTTSGKVLQLHKHNFPARDISVDAAYVINDSTTPYERITNLATTNTTSSGATLRSNNTFYSLVVWGVVSEDDPDCKIFINSPSGSYGNSTDAINDPNGFSNFTIPVEYRGTGFLIARVILRYQTADAGTLTEVQTEDLRGLSPSQAVGGGTSVGSTEFSDNLFRLHNVSDVSKEVGFDTSGITTATTRTIDIPDVDGVMAVSSMTDAFVFSGDVTTSGKVTLSTPTELTISTGAVTATKAFHTIDTEADAASDDLDTISGGSDGDILIIRAVSDTRSVVVKDGTGNLALSGDMTLDSSNDTLQLIYDATLTKWLELTRSNNSA